MYQLIYSKRRTIGISIDDNLNVVVRAPKNAPKSQIDKIVAKNEDWILTHIEKKRIYLEKHLPSSPERQTELRQKAAEIIPPKVKYFAKLMGVTPSGIKITGARKRFGSCNSKNGLCFSFLLMEYPEEAIDYVVVHELAHIRHHNHSPEFYAFIAKTMPDYKSRQNLLRK